MERAILVRNAASLSTQCDAAKETPRIDRALVLQALQLAVGRRVPSAGGHDQYGH